MFRDILALYNVMIAKMILLQSCAMKMKNYSAVWKNSSNSKAIFSSNSTVNNKSTADPPLHLITLLLPLLIMQFIVLQLSFHTFGPTNQACGLRKLTRSSFSQTSSTRCTRLACGQVSFQRAGKGRVLSCRQSRASPPRNHRRTGCSVCLTQRAIFSKESSVTASKPLLRALGVSQITSTSFGRAIDYQRH
ncbi:unnamed protein product [Trichogramma brassicae]|uniref:Uncharacterized protein n=1 Tax=Trichogramma brassicae TaxID=86971 RepID=A0A6H5I6R1_9HYME|nr:unnamed protein product [Trichogramma brassicae]